MGESNYPVHNVGSEKVGFSVAAPVFTGALLLDEEKRTLKRLSGNSYFGHFQGHCEEQSDEAISSFLDIMSCVNFQRLLRP